jgi:hypothetical protein
MGLVFFITLFWGFLPMFMAIFTFPQERAMLAKERGSDMYRLSAYFMSRILGDFPLDFLLPVVFLLITYFMGHLVYTAKAFFLTVVIVFLIVMASQVTDFCSNSPSMVAAIFTAELLNLLSFVNSYFSATFYKPFILFNCSNVQQAVVLAIGACVTDLKKATTMASVVLIAFLLSGGFFVQVNLYQLSTKYALFGFTIQQSKLYYYFSQNCPVNLLDKCLIF